MADLNPQERLFPSLLDRLTDDQPDESVEPRQQRVFSVHRLRAAVLRDLAWLMNTCHMEVSEDLDHYDEVQRSVLNYGIPDLTGKTLSGLQIKDIERAIRDAILTYEPRIIAKTLRVRGNKSNDSASGNAVTFEIEGEMWARPFPERLYLRSELDLETGSIQIEEV